jgi:hypothetical protein
VFYPKVLIRQSPGNTEKIHVKAETVTGPRFVPATHRV